MAYEINGQIVKKTLLQYVPHGINKDMFKPLPIEDDRLMLRRKDFLQNKNYNYCILYNSRNISRKRTSDIILAYRAFCDNLNKEDAEKCCLILHTEIMSEAGTDLIAVKEALCPNYNIIFSPAKILPEDLNCLYNIADVTISISSSEGFGLSTAESIMAGTPIIVNLTGGLQDQTGQVNNEGKPIDFDRDFGSNFYGDYKNFGVWARVLIPTTHYIQGSLPTPYIHDDVCSWKEAAEAMMYWYLMPKEERKRCGLKGREWACGEGGLNAVNMSNQFIEAMDFVFDKWRQNDPVELVTKDNYIGHKMPNNSPGFVIPKINKDNVNKEIETVISKLS